MDEAQLRFLFVFTDLIAPLVAGYLCYRYQVITQDFCNKLIKINIRLVVSILSFLSFWTLKISTDLLWLPLFGFLACIIPGLNSHNFGCRGNIEAGFFGNTVRTGT